MEFGISFKNYLLASPYLGTCNKSRKEESILMKFDLWLS
jgi:hypothetical protein